MIVTIDPRIKYNYATWYICGFENVLGRKNVTFDIQPFLNLDVASKSQYIQGMPCIINRLGEEFKVYIDYHDDSSIVEDRYEWCDLYAKVNPTEKNCLLYKKLFPIGPSFGVRDRGIIPLLIRGLNNYRKSRRYSLVPFSMFMLDYVYPWWRRTSLEEYEIPSEVDDNYAFMLSTLWNGENEKSNINDVRLQFMLSCKNSGVNLDGGFFYIGVNSDKYKKYLEEYKDFLYFKRLSIHEYLTKIKRSCFVFSCPSVAGCLGWKLAEYLMMGKAIISKPINHPMPGEGLIHGKHIHIVNSREDMKDAIALIRNDAKYRRQLETNARKYYEEYLTPSCVVERIIDHLNWK